MKTIHHVTSQKSRCLTLVSGLLYKMKPPSKDHIGRGDNTKLNNLYFNERCSSLQRFHFLVGGSDLSFLQNEVMIHCPCFWRVCLICFT